MDKGKSFGIWDAGLSALIAMLLLATSIAPAIALSEQDSALPMNATLELNQTGWRLGQTNGTNLWPNESNATADLALNETDTDPALNESSTTTGIELNETNADLALNQTNATTPMFDQNNSTLDTLTQANTTNTTPELPLGETLPVDTDPPAITINSAQNATLRKGNYTFNISTDENAMCTLYLGGADYSEVCYQESANVSTACGGLTTGTYARSGDWYAAEGPLGNIYDGDWTTRVWNYRTDWAISVSYLYINYTIPPNALSAVFTGRYQHSWGEAYDAHGNLIQSYDDVNTTIPPHCFSGSTLATKQVFYNRWLGKTSDVEFYCLNATSQWQLIKDIAPGVPAYPGLKFYEDGIWWGISSTTHTWTQTIPEGNYSGIHFTCEDEGGNFAESSSYWLNVETPDVQLNQTFTYDANGNMVSGGEYTYEYNDANRLSKVFKGGILAEQYWYGPNGERIKKLSNGTVTYYVGEHYEVENGSATSYYYANSDRVAKKNSSGTFYYHSDHLGSNSVMTSSSGSLVEKTKYAPFGAVLSGGSEKYGYTGQEKDDTGLMYYHARYYNPVLMRFVEADPVVQDVYDPQGLNRYSYVRNNPLRYTDPTGNCLWDGCIFEAAAIGYLVGSLAGAWSTADAKGLSFEEAIYDTDVQRGSAAAGAGAAVTVATAGAAAPGVAAAGTAYGAGGALTATMAVGGASAVAGDTVAQMSYNGMSGQGLTNGLSAERGLTAWAIGSGTAGVFSVGGKLITQTRNAQQTLKTSQGDFKFTPHAYDRISTAGRMTVKDTVNTIETGQKFSYYHGGIWKNGFYDSINKYLVATYKGKILTVIDKADQKYINNLKCTK